MKSTKHWRVLDLLRVFPTALDQWIMLVIGLHAFGKEIPWYLWVIIGGEVLSLIRIALEKQE